MRDVLAERLLAQVLAWTPEEMAKERPAIQAMAAYKYDEYQQFSPGMRFIESLALWIGQFKDAGERAAAYAFVKQKLVFLSSAELDHLIEVCYPDFVRPRIRARTAAELGIDEHRVVRIATNPLFRVRERQCLFLGLSDGSHVDAFRRFNRNLSHEQVLPTYEIAKDRVKSLLEKLTADIGSDLKRLVPSEDPKFRTVVLLDDLSASGTSYLRQSGSVYKGKIAKLHDALTTGDATTLVDTKSLEILIVLYVATKQAQEHLAPLVTALFQPLGVSASVIALHTLSDAVRIRADIPTSLTSLINDYYDPSIHDEHMRVGGTTDSKYGYGACGLPLVMSHNTPNNSLPLLWFPEGCAARGLFPRVQRHRSNHESDEAVGTKASA